MGSNEVDLLNCVKVASLNVDGLISNETKQQKINDWMINNDIDVLCVQEWNANYYALEKKFPKKEFSESYEVYNNNNYQTAIIYNVQYRVHEHKFKLIDNARLVWRTWITIYGKNDALNICSLYWSPSDVGKFDVMETLKNDIKQIEQINSDYNNFNCINGDFNAKSELWDNLYNNEKEDKRGEYIEQFLLDEQYFIQNNGFPTHFNRKTKKESAIDLTITNGNLSKLIKHWYVDQNSRNQDYLISDHYFIVIWIDFRVIKITDKPYVMFDYKEGKYEDYCVIIQDLLPDWYNYFYDNWKDKSKLNEITEYLQNIIKYGAMRTFGIKKVSKRDKFWLGKRASMAIKERKSLKKKYERFKNKESKEAKKVKTKINKCSEIVRNCKLTAIESYRENMESKIEGLCIKDSKYFYHLAKKATNDNKSSISPLKDSNGKIIAATPKKQAEILHKHFNREIGENEKCYTDEHKKWHEKISNTVNKEWIENETEEGKLRCQKLNAPITKQQILHAIEKSKLDTACGHDNISMRMIHIARFEIVGALELLFNLIFLVYGIFPMCWLLINIFPIPKPGRDNSIVKNNRPISLQ